MEVAQRHYRQAFQFEEWQSQCRATAQAVQDDIAAFMSAMGNLEAGLRFYSQLQDEVQILGQTVRDFLMSRKAERDDLIEDLGKRGAGELAAVRHGRLVIC